MDFFFFNSLLRPIHLRDSMRSFDEVGVVVDIFFIFLCRLIDGLMTLRVLVKRKLLLGSPKYSEEEENVTCFLCEASLLLLFRLDGWWQWWLW